MSSSRKLQSVFCGITQLRCLSVWLFRRTPSKTGQYYGTFLGRTAALSPVSELRPPKVGMECRVYRLWVFKVLQRGLSEISIPSNQGPEKLKLPVPRLENLFPSYASTIWKACHLVSQRTSNRPSGSSGTMDRQIARNKYPPEWSVLLRKWKTV